MKTVFYILIVIGTISLAAFAFVLIKTIRNKQKNIITDNKTQKVTLALLLISLISLVAGGIIFFNTNETNKNKGSNLDISTTTPPSSAASAEPTFSPLPDKEAQQTIEDTLNQTFEDAVGKDHYTLEHKGSSFIVTIWEEELTTDNISEPDVQTNWQEFVDSVNNASDICLKCIKQVGVKNPSFTINIVDYNDHNTMLLTDTDGKVIYNYLDNNINNPTSTQEPVQELEEPEENE